MSTRLTSGLAEVVLPERHMSDPQGKTGSRSPFPAVLEGTRTGSTYADMIEGTESRSPRVRLIGACRSLGVLCEDWDPMLGHSFALEPQA